MITRVTNQTLAQSALRNLQSNMSDLARLQNRASSRQSITRPSDDPTGTADSLRIRAAQQASEQHGRNIADGNGWLATVDSALTASVSILHRVRDLTLQGANDGALSPEAKNAIALELKTLGDELFSVANRSYLGRNVFAGNSNAGAAFDAVFTHNGSPTSTVQRRIGDDATVRVDADGVGVFGEGDTSVFAVISRVVGDLNAGVNVRERLNEVDDRLQAIVGYQAEVGTRQVQLDRAEEANMERSIALETQRSGVEDVDLARVILDLKLQETSYQSALAVTARVLQPTLMDFLR
ncbi:MAG: flagellar hook-associated protein 3 [Microbacteriaceae bacterium]|jgi:flagellar hook-associated protein 3 FlgL|nr:flagellar hook-associated protein 3 [Microbacteriaceae bacterium]HEV7956251.1 flagellar hook-associated protein FlgL [Marisediminicola sp.]